MLRFQISFHAGTQLFKTLLFGLFDVGQFDDVVAKIRLDYIAYIASLIDSTIDTLDLDAQETGLSWYKNMSKLSHQLMSLRHIQGHVGQLSELLMARGIGTDWITKAQQFTPEISRV